MSYIKEVLKKVKSSNNNEKEFLQSVDEVIHSLSPILDKNKVYQKNAILERLTEPDRIITFRVVWNSDNGKINVNRGYRVQFNNCVGAYKGGLRFHPTVNQSILKFLGFEQTFKNSITSLPIGGAKGGSDFDPKGKTDSEIMRFCNSFMTELHRHIGDTIDIPAGDIGVGERELGYLFGNYKRIKKSFEGTLTGKGLEYGGSQVRKEATGYGLIYIVNEMLNDFGKTLKNQKISISGSGNVAIYAAQKAISEGATVVAMSDSDGFIFDKNGIDLDTVKKIKEIDRDRLKVYKDYHPQSEYCTKSSIWDIPVDIALPCATQNELNLEHSKNLVKNGVKLIAEGANMPTTPDALEHFKQKNILFLSGKAANSGGVATSVFEMSQNSIHQYWSFEQVDTVLKNTMTNIYKNIKLINQKYNLGQDFVSGANILGFEKVANAMIAQGF